MTAFIKFFTRVRRNEDGSVAMEYGLLAALIAVAIILGATNAGTQLGGLFNNVANKLGNVASTVH